MSLLIHCLILLSYLFCDPKVPSRYPEGAFTIFIAVTVFGSVLGISWELFGG